MADCHPSGAVGGGDFRLFQDSLENAIIYSMMHYLFSYLLFILLSDLLSINFYLLFYVLSSYIKKAFAAAVSEMEVYGGLPSSRCSDRRS